MTIDLILQKIDAGLHTAIDNDQILLTELELVRPLLLLQNSNPEATLALKKIEKLLLEQGKLLFDVRKQIRTVAENMNVFEQMMQTVPKKRSR